MTGWIDYGYSGLKDLRCGTQIQIFPLFWCTEQMITSNKGTKITPILTSFIFQKMYLSKITMIQNFPLLVHQFFGKMHYGMDFILEVQGFQCFFVQGGPELLVL